MTNSYFPSSEWQSSLRDYVGWWVWNPNGTLPSEISDAKKVTCATCYAICETGVCRNPESKYSNNFRWIENWAAEACSDHLTPDEKAEIDKIERQKREKNLATS